MAAPNKPLSARELQDFWALQTKPRAEMAPLDSIPPWYQRQGMEFGWRDIPERVAGALADTATEAIATPAGMVGYGTALTGTVPREAWGLARGVHGGLTDSQPGRGFTRGRERGLEEAGNVYGGGFGALARGSERAAEGIAQATGLSEGEKLVGSFIDPFDLLGGGAVGLAGVPLMTMRRESDLVQGLASQGALARVAGKAEDVPRSRMVVNQEVARLQRGAPERAMIDIQRAQGGGVLDYVVEHVGDLTNRLGARGGDATGIDLAIKKINSTLGTLRNPYGFEKEMLENFAANARVYGTDPAAHARKIDGLLDAYADAHKALPVEGEAMTLARDAAVALGRKDWDGAATKLEKLKGMLEGDPAAFQSALRGEGGQTGLFTDPVLDSAYAKMGGVREVTPEEFVAARDTFAPKHRKNYLSPTTAEEFSSDGTRLFLSNDGETGGALSRSGDFQNLWSSGTNKRAGDVMAAVIVQDPTTDVRSLDAFQGYLTEDLYPRHGFVATKSVPNYEKGEPHVIYMKRQADLQSSGMPAVEPIVPLSGAERARTNPRSFTSESFEAYGNEIGANLGPLNPGVRIRGTGGYTAEIPGGYSGTFTQADLAQLKASPIDVNRLSTKQRVQLQKKIGRTLDPGVYRAVAKAGGDPYKADIDDLEVFSRLSFAQQSMNTPLLQNELGAIGMRPRSWDELVAMGDDIPWARGTKPSAAERAAYDQKLTYRYNIQASQIPDPKIKVKVDYGDVPFVPSRVVSKLNTKASGIASKVASKKAAKDFVGPWKPGTAGRSAFPPSAMAEFARDFAADPRWYVKKGSESWETYVTRLSSQTNYLGTKTGSFAAGMLYPEKAGISAMDLHMARNFDLDLTKLGSRKLKRIVRGKPNPDIPDEIHNIDWGVKGPPEYIEMPSDEYIRGLHANQETGTATGLELFMEQWRLWDGYRGRFEPHEVNARGLYKMQKPNETVRNQQASANQAAGWGASGQPQGLTSKVDDRPKAPVLPRKTEHWQDLLLYGAPPLAVGTGIAAGEDRRMRGGLDR